MTWLSSWPTRTGPAYREHPTEAAAEQHAHNVIANGTATTAVVFEIHQEDHQ